MRRSELYAKVWTTPMTKLATEFGISDVGLAKACRRHAVPVPPRGYWAKLRAGQKPSQTPLPTPELDVDVEFATSDPQERLRQKQIEQQRREELDASVRDAVRVSPMTFAKNLDDAHPFVKATHRYCERIPKLVERFKGNGIQGWSTTKPEDRPPHEERGRYLLFRKGLLDITASLDDMEWVLRFHATVLKGLTRGGMTVAFREAQPSTRRGDPDRGPAVEACFKGETFTIKFSQGYRRIHLSAQDLAKARKERSWASEYEFRPSEKFTFSISGDVPGAQKVWQGTTDKLEQLTNEIVCSAFELVPLQVELRKRREAAAERAREEAEIRAREGRIESSKAEQLKQAFLMAEADARVRQLEEFLARLEADIGTLNAPYAERAAVWLQVVREQLKSDNPVDEMLTRCLSVPSWGTWPPDWWPQSPAPT